MIYGNFDFAGTILRLPGGLMMGWSTREYIWKLYFDEAGYLDKVMVHNQAYYRDN